MFDLFLNTSLLVNKEPPIFFIVAKYEKDFRLEFI